MAISIVYTLPGFDAPIAPAYLRALYIALDLVPHTVTFVGLLVVGLSRDWNQYRIGYWGASPAGVVPPAEPQPPPMAINAYGSGQEYQGASAYAPKAAYPAPPPSTTTATTTMTGSWDMPDSAPSTVSALTSRPEAPAGQEWVLQPVRELPTHDRPELG